MDKIALVTGSEGAIGQEIVKAFLKENFLVIGIDKNISNRTKSKNYKPIAANLFNFSVDKEYRKNTVIKIHDFIPKKISKFIIINNAAIQVLKNVNEVSWSDWEKSFTVNTVSPFFLIQAFIGLLKSSKGHVINISSVHSKLTKKNFTCYAASKAALESLTKSLALELSPLGISVNAIAPAAINTNLLKDSFKSNPEKLNELKHCHPSKDIGRPKNIAKFIKTVAISDDFFLTGSVIDYDGGISNVLHDPEHF